MCERAAAAAAWRRACAPVVLTGLLAAGSAPARSVTDADALLEAADAARAPFEQGVVHLRVSAADGASAAVADEIEVYVGKADELLAVFRSGKQRGRRVLAVAGRTWLIVPHARAVPITGQQRLAGAAALADLGRLRLAAAFEAALRADTEELDGRACHVLDLVARDPAAPYPTATLWSGVADRLPRRLVLRLASGKEAKALDFVAYREEGGRRVLERLQIHDRLRTRGRATRIEFLAYEARALEPAWFTVEGARALP